MASSCSTAEETENEMLEAALNLAKENPDVEFVKDLLSAKPEDIKVNKLKETCSHVEFQVAVKISTFVMKKLKKELMYDAKEKEKLISEAKRLVRLQNLVPGLTPVVYCWSDKHGSMALEDISAYSSLDSELKSGSISKATVSRVAEAVARLHKATDVIGQPELFKELEPEFQHDHNALDCFASKLFTADLERLNDGRLKAAMTRFLTNAQTKAAIEEFIDNAKNKKQALLHGRIVGDSVIIQGDQIKFVGGTSLFFGPCAFDVGRLVAQYLSSYYEHMLTEEDNDKHRQIMYRMIDYAKDTVNEYQTAMGDTLQERDQFISVVSGFAGLEMIRRALMVIPEESKALEVMESGKRLFDARGRIHDSDRMVVIGLMLTL